MLAAFKKGIQTTMDIILFGERTDTHPGVIAARELAQREDQDPPHVYQVTKLALELFDTTRYLHKLGPSDRRLLEAAALLHDLGINRDMATHHKHSRDMILEAELPGFSQREQRIIACVARYHRKAHPKPSHRIYTELRHKDKVLVCQLAGILRIADGLDRTHAATAQRLAVTHKDNRVTITVTQTTENETDLWGGNRKRGLFEQLFEVKVTILSHNGKRAPAA